MNDRVVVTVLGVVPAYRPGLLARQQTNTNHLAYSEWVHRAKLDARMALSKATGATKPLPSSVSLEACFYGAQRDARRDDLLRSALDAVRGVIVDDESQVRCVSMFMHPRMYPSVQKEDASLIQRERTVITVINLDPLQAACK